MSVRNNQRFLMPGKTHIIVSPAGTRAVWQVHAAPSHPFLILLSRGIPGVCGSWVHPLTPAAEQSALLLGHHSVIAVSNTETNQIEQV